MLFRLTSRALPFVTLCVSSVINSCWAANPWQLEAGEDTAASTFAAPAFTAITFSQPFLTTPVVVVLATDEGGDSSALRLRNVTTAGFEIAPVEPTGNDGPHVAMTFHYIAATPGVHVMPTGETVVVGFHDTSSVQRAGVVGGPNGWDTVSFGATLASSAAIIAAIQTDNSETGSPPGGPSVPWLTVAMRNPSATSVEMALERSEVAAGTVATERIGYIAFPSTTGSFLDDSAVLTDWSALETADNIRGFDNGCFANAFSTVTFSAPRIVATKTSRDGGDGGWLRRCSITGSTIGLTVDEDIANDTERGHTTERAGVIGFSRSFHATFESVLTAQKTVSVESDPVNPGSGPFFAIPGARIRYSVDLQSTGDLPADDDSLIFIDALPPEISLVVADIDPPNSGPVRFTDGATSSALTYTFTSLGSITDDIDFSNDGGATFTYTPTIGANGADPAITHIRVAPKGAFAGALSANPSFQLEFDAIIE